MKINAILLSVLSTGYGAPKNDGEKAEKRYSDMKAIAEHIFDGAGETFDEQKYWTYGCHCFMLGDRPLSEMGMGAPVDPLDRSCKVYKDCQKCVRETHGNECIGEFVKYSWSNKGSSDVKTSETAGTCERELFECDRQFAHDMLAQSSHYVSDYHTFFGPWDNKDPANCPKGPGGPNRRECCGGSNKPYVLFNNNKLECCSDGVPRVSC